MLALFIAIIWYTSRGRYVERSAYLHLLRRWKWALLLATLVAGIIGLLVTSQIPPTYQAETRLLVGPINADIDTVRAAESLTATYAEIATAEPTLNSVIDELNLDMTPAELREAMAATATSATRIVSIVVTGTDPIQVADIANTLAAELDELTSSGLSRPEGRVRAIAPAVVPTDPIAPNVMLLTMLSAMAGLLIAAVIAMGIEYFSNTVRAAEDLGDLTGSAVLGEVNVGHGYRGSPVQPLVVEAQPESKTALGYRLLASRMSLGGNGADAIRSVLIVGSQAGEQVGELSANLAAVLARTGRSVSLVDADDLEGQVTGMFVPDRRTGLSELLALAPEAIAGTAAVDDVRVKRAPGIELIPAGNTESRTVREDTVSALLESLTKRSDLVLVSGAPIHRSAQSLLWAKHVDAMVFVARADTTRIENLRHAVDSVHLVNARILGSVLLVHRASGADRWRKAPRPEPGVQHASVAVTPRPSASQWPAQAAPPPPGTQPAISSDRRAVGDKGIG